MNTIRKCFLLSGLLAVLTACAGLDSASEQPSPNPRPPAASAPVTPSEPDTPPEPVTPSEPYTPADTNALPTAITGPTGLTGAVMAASDVSGQPDDPLPDQMVLAVPVEKAGEILGVSGDQLAPEVLRFLKASLPEANPAMINTLTGVAGDYTLHMAPGEVVLCVADSEATPPDFPATTRGCGLTRVQPGELRRVDISSGFGEILLVER